MRVGKSQYAVKIGLVRNVKYDGEKFNIMKYESRLHVPPTYPISQLRQQHSEVPHNKPGVSEP